MFIEVNDISGYRKLININSISKVNEFDKEKKSSEGELKEHVEKQERVEQWPDPIPESNSSEQRESSESNGNSNCTITINGEVTFHVKESYEEIEKRIFQTIAFHKMAYKS